MEKKLYAIGEALIDFIPQESGRPMKDVLGFCPKVGGAPANVCGAFTRLGGKSEMILLAIKLKKHWKKTELEPPVSTLCRWCDGSRFAGTDFG